MVDTTHMALVALLFAACGTETDGAAVTGGAAQTGGIMATTGGVDTVASGGVAMGTGGRPAATGGDGGLSGGTVRSTGGGQVSGGATPSSGGETAMGGGSSASTGGAQVTLGAVRAIASPPIYLGSASDGCTMQRATVGFEPAADSEGGHPLFMYFVGTRFYTTDQSAKYDSEAALKVTEAMARRGFYALSVDYDNGFSLATQKAKCAFSPAEPMSLVSLACALPHVDCDKGIATWGHSQGAAVAHEASAHDPRVRAVWTTGYSGGFNPLPSNRLRVVNGENDTMNANWETLNRAAGMDASECPDDGRDSCLRADGSGWTVVREQDCEVSTADHCWFDRVSCGASAITLEPNWTDPASAALFALEPNADWVAETARRL